MFKNKCFNAILCCNVYSYFLLNKFFVNLDFWPCSWIFMIGLKIEALSIVLRSIGQLGVKTLKSRHVN